MSSSDNLYNIRFFDIQDIKNILQMSRIGFKNVAFQKFGGPADRLYTLAKRLPVLTPLVRRLVPRLYQYQPWNTAERIAVIIELDK
jgi:hypothetical protein